MKPGRNDLCPCGSGRKYKHCCIELYSAGRAYPYTTQTISDFPATNKQEIITAETSLSHDKDYTIDMAIINDLSSAPVEELEHILAFNKELDPKCLKKSDFILDAIQLFSILMEEGEIVPGRKHKTDLKAIMDDAVMEFLTKNKPRFKLMNVEYEFPKYENLCLLLRETGYIELGSKADEELDLPTVKITQKALDCINSRRYNELFHEAIQYYLFNFNWLYKKGMNEKCEIIQDSALPALFIFTKLSKRSWYPFIDFYKVMIRLYPDIDTCYVKNISIKINKHTYALLFFEELCVYFGLMEHDCEFSKDFLHKPAGNYRTTELYRQYFGWKR